MRATQRHTVAITPSDGDGPMRWRPECPAEFRAEAQRAAYGRRATGWVAARGGAPTSNMGKISRPNEALMTIAADR